MKLVTSVAALARAAALASNAINDTTFAGASATQIRAGEDTTLTLNNLDFQISMMVPAAVEAPGKIAVPAERLNKLVEAMPADSEVTVEVCENVALIQSGRRRFKLATIPPSVWPNDLALDVEVGRAALSRVAALRLFALTSFATVSPKDPRAYLHGTFLHNLDGALVAVSTDGHKLGCYSVTSPSILSDDRRLIVPAPAAEMVVRILADKNLDSITLRRSRTLFAVEGANVRFTSRLLDADYPRYETVIAAPAEGATCERAALRSALARARAVSGAREAQLTWADNELRLTVTDASDDVVDAKVVAPGSVAIDARKLSEITDELDGQHVGLSAGAPGMPLRITTDDPGFVAILAPRISGGGHA